MVEEVLETQQREHDGDLVTLELAIDGSPSETVTCTGAHPFWVVQGEALDQRPACAELPADQSAMTPSGRWTEARWLRVGDKFLTKTGRSATVAGLTIRLECVPVYNLHIIGLRQYAVGADGVLVHNKENR